MKVTYGKGFMMIKDKDCVRLFNKLAFLCDDQIPTINHMKEINFRVIARILICIFNRRGVYPNLDDEFAPIEKQFASLINFLSSDILHIPLDHIKPEDLIAHNSVSLYNLLEILAACELYLPFNEQNQEPTTSTKDEAVQITTESLQDLSISQPLPPSPLPSDHSLTWSSPTNSSLSLNSTFILSSSSSSLSLSSTSTHIPTPSVIGSPIPRLIKISTQQSTHSPFSPSRKSSKSKTSSPDSACICYRLRNVAVNTENPPELNSHLDKSPSSSSSTSIPNFLGINSTQKIDKATNTEPQDLMKDHQDINVRKMDQTFDTYETLASHRFALEIGHKLQRALKLEEATKQIEAKLCAITGELNTQNKRTNKPANGKRKTFQPPWKNKPIIRPTARKVASEASTKLNVYTKPLVCMDRVQKLMKSRPSPSTSRGRLKLDINSGQLLLDEWKRQSSLAAVHTALKSTVTGCPNSQRLKRIREQSLIREARTERARIHRLISDLERQACSKYLTTQAKEQQLIKSQAGEKIKSFRDDLTTYKDMVKNQMDKEQEKRKRLLDAFTNYYQQQLSLIKDKLDQEESDLTARYKHSNVTYNKLRRELKSNLEKEIGSLI